MATSPEPSTNPESLIRKIKALPHARVAEVEDFVDFIGLRESQLASGQALKDAVRNASAPALAAIWNNPEDDAYDDL